LLFPSSSPALSPCSPSLSRHPGCQGAARAVCPAREAELSSRPSRRGPAPHGHSLT
ncbi:unnamed protein product, partial [Coccothraustes coccothraustes]